jgi:hypothetical protein
METTFRALAELALALSATVGSIALALGLLNRRDRRKAVLIQRVCAELPPVVVRSDLAVEAGSGLLLGSDWVKVDLGLRPASEVWAAIARLRRALPARVRLTVDGQLAGREPARVTVERMSDRSSLRPAA